MGQDIYASIGLTTDYRREDSSSVSGRITLQHSMICSFCCQKLVHGKERCAHCVGSCGYTNQRGYIFLTNAATIELHLGMRYRKLYMHDINLLG